VENTEIPEEKRWDVEEHGSGMGRRIQMCEGARLQSCHNFTQKMMGLYPHAVLHGTAKNLPFVSSLSAFGGLAGGEHLRHFLNAILACFRPFGALNPINVFLFVGIGESGERLLLRGNFGEGGLDIRGNIDGAWSVVKGKLHLDGVAGSCRSGG